VDLGIVPSPFSLPPPTSLPALKACTLPKGERFEDGTIDLGTGYDCLDVMGNTSNASVGEFALRNRQLLKSTMARAGFRPYAREWWHFELVNAPFGQGFDFEVSAPSSLNKRLAR
jgi:D-alanyl-D-alanine dipeptidase